MEPKASSELISLVKDEKRKAFLLNYPTFCMVSRTAKAIGIERSIVYHWLNKDSYFASAFYSIKKEVDAHRLEEIEKEMHTRAMSKSDLLLIFEAKALAPEKYREKTEHRIIGDIVVKSYIPRPEQPQIATEHPQELKKGEDAIKQEEDAREKAV